MAEPSGGSRARDSRRAAVYSAEDQWSALLDRGGVVDFFGTTLDVPVQRRFGDLGAVRTYVGWVLQHPDVVSEYPDAEEVTVRERAGQRSAHYEPASRTVAIPLRAGWAAREAVVLHEVAHHLASSRLPADRDDDAWHGPTYTAAMLTVVAAALGDAAALLLRAGYDSAGATA